MSRVEINDDKLYEHLTWFVVRLREVCDGMGCACDMEDVLDFLFVFMGRWSQIDGKIDYDYVENLIKSLR